jgi:alpha-tubulin suppressor-like RCC1 family protein
MKKISWTAVLVCAFVVLGALFFGCNQPMDVVDDPPPSGPQTQGEDQQDEEDQDDDEEDDGEDEGDDDEDDDPSFPINSSFGNSGHALLLKSDGTVWATGYNRYGQFGNGTKIDSSPFTTTTFTQVADHTVSVGYTGSAGDSFIIKDDGSLWAAGQNNYETHTSATTTFEKEFDSGVKAVSVYQGIYVLKDDGSLWVRGKASTNSNGQLGTGDQNAVSTWTKVIESGVVAIAKSSAFGLVLKDDGAVWGTGQNYQGALGLGPKVGEGVQATWANTTSFTEIFRDAIAAIAIAAGNAHSLILKADGTVWAAGYYQYGQLGDGKLPTPTNTDQVQISFQQIQELSDVTAISAGLNHSLILKADGTVWAAGDNTNGQLGIEKDKLTSNRSATFIPIASGVKQILAQGNQTFIVKDDGTLWVTGVNTGILGGVSKSVYEFTQITLPE